MISSTKTSSTILYKFRSSVNFESVELPGTSARLFDIKRAIVKAKKLDSGAQQLEFDLSVKNALTEEEYTDESMLLPRGTRLVIQRLPATKGYGLLAKIARAEAGMSTGGNTNSISSSAFSAPTGYFTIQSRAGDEDEFVDSATTGPLELQQKLPQAAASMNADADSEEKELAALKAVTDQAASIYRPHTTLNRATAPNKFGGATGAVIGGAPRQAPMNTFIAPPYARPAPNSMKFSTDPELKEHELKQMQTKKRATGIPRTFLTMSGAEGNATGTTDPGTEGEATGMIRLQPNNIGFEALIQRGGGQSESGGAQNRSLEYALKLTATTIPEHLQCGICHGVVKNAMLVPWDTQGRAVCELCMRDNLAKNGFKCPLTGMDGVSPDDLYPNHGLRKVADLFVQQVMELMDQVLLKQQADEEEEQKREREDLLAASKDAKKTVDDVDMDDIARASKNSKSTLQSKRKRHDPLDFDADFGGDVFDVSKEDNVLDDDLKSLKRMDPTADLNQSDKGTMDNDKINGDDLFSENVETNLESDKNKSFASANGDTDPQKIVPIESPLSGSQPGFTMEENLIANKQSSLDTEVDPSTNTKDETSLNHDGDKMDVNLPINGRETTVHPFNENKNATASVPVIDRKELVKSRGPPPGYRIGPAGGAVVHGRFPPSSPVPMMQPAGPVQPSPASTRWNNQIQARGDGGSLNGREGFRGRGPRGRGRNFRGGYPYSHDPHPSTPQEFSEHSTPIMDTNQDTATDIGQSDFSSVYVRNSNAAEAPFYYQEEMHDLQNHDNPNREFYGDDFSDAREGRGFSPFHRGGPFVPRGRGRSFDSRGGRGFYENNFGRGRGRDMPPYHHDNWQDFGGGRGFEPSMGRGRDSSFGRGYDMMARGHDPRGGRSYEPRGGRFPDQMGGRGFDRGGFPRGAGRGRF